MAKRLGVGIRQVENYLVEGMPGRKEGRIVLIPWGEAFAWFIARREELAGRRGPVSEEVEDARRRKEIASAKMAELDLAKAEGSLIVRSEAESWVADLFGALAARLQTAPGKFAPRCVGLTTVAEARRVLEGLATETLGAWQEAAHAVAEDAA
jgi:hypothetical protein